MAFTIPTMRRGLGGISSIMILKAVSITSILLSTSVVCGVVTNTYVSVSVWCLL